MAVAREAQQDLPAFDRQPCSTCALSNPARSLHRLPKLTAVAERPQNGACRSREG